MAPPPEDPRPNSTAGPAGIPDGPLAVLQRIRGREPMAPLGERCEMCGVAIEDEHSHVVNTTSRSLMCTCRGCYLLFDYKDAKIKYRAVPQRYLFFPDFYLTPMQWDDLQIPVSMAFFFHHSELGHQVAFYPSPAGATESELPLGAWEDIVTANPQLAGLASDVEAILVRAQDGAFECFLVPIDACYELVGHLRSGWRGFDGGQEVRQALADFFARVQAKSQPSDSGAVGAGGQA